MLFVYRACLFFKFIFFPLLKTFLLIGHIVNFIRASQWTWKKQTWIDKWFFQCNDYGSIATLVVPPTLKILSALVNSCSIFMILDKFYLWIIETSIYLLFNTKIMVWFQFHANLLNIVDSTIDNVEFIMEMEPWVRCYPIRTVTLTIHATKQQITNWLIGLNDNPIIMENIILPSTFLCSEASLDIKFKLYQIIL